MTRNEFRTSIRGEVSAELDRMTSELGIRPAFRRRLLEVHGWFEGSDRPPPEPDCEALGIYGCCYLAATAGAARLGALCPDDELHLKRRYCRQAIDLCRHHREPPHQPAFYDSVMSTLGLPTRFDFRSGGTEVLALWTPGTGTAFLPLAGLVRDSCEVFWYWPDVEDPSSERDEFEAEMRGLASLLAAHQPSQFHGGRIRRILGCYRALANRAGMLILPDEVAAMGVAEPAAVDDEVRNLQIDLGLRAAVPTRRSTSRRRRRNR